MAFYDTTPSSFSVKIREGSVQQDIGMLLGLEWVEPDGDATVQKFFRVSYNHTVADPQAIYYDDSSITFYLARHHLYKNMEGRLLGLAMVGSFTVDYAELRNQASGPTATRQEVVDWIKTDAAIQWIIDQGIDTISNTVWYWYMAESEPDFTMHLGTYTWNSQTYKIMGIPWKSSELERAVLDIEVSKTDVVSNGVSYELRVINQKSTVMQSPISKSIVRTSLLEDLYDESMNNQWQQTNWWPDSEIRMVGCIDPNNLFLMVQCDNVPAWEGAVVPQIPLYFSKINPLDAGDSAYAFFTGSVAAKDSSISAIEQFDYDDPDRANFADKVLPLLKTYPGKPSNGIDTVMVSRSKFGARYQEYFLSWNAAPNLMPPLRNEGNHDYPRAWNHALSDEYRFQFNPSRYSNKVHSSKIYIVHPEEGVRGNLMNAIGLSALNFNSGKLRVRRSTCPDKYDVYRYFLAEGVSPLTKRPGTAYRPMGVGIYDVGSSDPA